jgi:serine/threonine protein kinase
MPDVSTRGREAMTGTHFGHGKPADRPPLAGVACCDDLAEREGLPAPIAEEIPDGTILDGRLRIREAIGRSELSTIYRGEDLADGGQVVAVKMPLPKIAADPVSIGRFEREERILSALHHPCLLRFIPTDGPKSRPYIVTEYLDGCTLAHVLHRARALPEKDALRIASAVCEGLIHMHDRGFMHRDLKPGNIMICRDHTLRIIDFGMAAEIGQEWGLLDSLTPLFGTPEYMAPEQVRNRRNDARTDIYCLGVILFQMLTGSLPFQDDDPWAAAQMRVTGDPPAPRRLKPGLSPQAEEIVLRAMRRIPADRHPTAAAFKGDLDLPEHVRVTGLSERLRAPRWRLSLHGTPLLTGALMGLAGLVSLALLFLLISHHSAPAR